MRLIKYLVVMLVTMLMYGCMSEPTKVNTVVHLSPIYVPDQMLTKEPVPAPPNKDKYVKLSSEDKERVLAKYIRELLLHIKKTRVQLDSIIKWNTEQKKIYGVNGKTWTR